ncbi:MAG: hypothetical protein ACLGQH_11215 [Acidobacteriota bacterium]
MTTKSFSTTTRMLLIASLLLLNTACQPQTRRYETSVRQETYVPETNNVRQFVRTGPQQYYYVDSRGGMHLVTREVTQPTGMSGMLYYIEDDNRPYSLDANQRLYTQDQFGRIYYIEDVRPNRATDSRVIVPESVPYRDMPTAYSQEPCTYQYEKCMQGCQGLSRREAYTYPTCVNNCEIIRNGCIGQ